MQTGPQGRPEGLHDDRPRASRSAARNAIKGQLPYDGRPVLGDRHDRPAQRPHPGHGLLGQLQADEVQLAAQGHRQPGSTFKVDGADGRAAQAASTPTRTTYSSQAARPQRSDRAGRGRSRPTRNTYGGSMNLVTGHAEVRQHRLRPARPRPRPRGRPRDRLRPGDHHQARRLPRRGPRRPEARRLAARDGQRLRDDRLRRLAQHAHRGQARSCSPNGKVDDLGKPKRVKKFSDGVTYEATKILEENVQGGTGTRAHDRLPGGGQDRHGRRLQRRLVRRLHAQALDRGVGRLPQPQGADAQRARDRACNGGSFPAQIWHDYMRRRPRRGLRRLHARRRARSSPSRSSASTRAPGTRYDRSYVLRQRLQQRPERPRAPQPQTGRTPRLRPGPLRVPAAAGAPDPGPAAEPGDRAGRTRRSDGSRRQPGAGTPGSRRRPAQ